MKQDSINQYVEQAQKAAEAVTDTDLKLKTYELVLTHLLQSGTASPVNTIGQPAPQHVVTTPGSPLQKASSWLELDPAVVSELVDLEGDTAELKLPTSKLPNKIADAQRLLVLLKLAFEKQAYSTKSIPAKTLVELCKEYSCADRNFAANIRDYDDYIAAKGARGSMKVYEIRLKGIEKAKDEFKAIAAS